MKTISIILFLVVVNTVFGQGRSEYQKRYQVWEEKLKVEGITFPGMLLCLSFSETELEYEKNDNGNIDYYHFYTNANQGGLEDLTISFDVSIGKIDGNSLKNIAFNTIKSKKIYNTKLNINTAYYYGYKESVSKYDVLSTELKDRTLIIIAKRDSSTYYRISFIVSGTPPNNHKELPSRFFKDFFSKFSIRK